jgi:hypothetical protein
MLEGMASAAESLTMENWPVLCTFLPKGWKEMARSTGALRRARDITDAEVLLRLLRRQVANGYSLAETAVRARQFGMRLSAVAVCKRLRASAGWLRWLAEQQRGTQPVIVASQGRVVRGKRPSLPLFTLAENRIDPLRLFRRLKVGPPPWSAPVQPPRGGGVRGRWLARQRSAEATRLARRRLERKARQRPKKRSRECWDAAPYVAVGTTLRAAFPAAGVLAL